MIKGTILYLSYDGMTDPLGESQVIPYLKGLSKKGHRISIISFEKKDRFILHGNRIKNKLKESNIDWYPLNYTKKPPVFSTIYDLYRLRKKAFQLQKENSFHIVHCRSYISSLIGLRLKKKANVKFIFDMRGFWADERVEGNLWKLSNHFYRFIYRFFKKKEIQFLNQADTIISLTQNAADEIRSWKKLHANLPITIIPCCVDIDLFNVEKINATKQEGVRNKLNIHANEKILLYLGSIGTWYLLKEMLLFFKELYQFDSSSKFLFITTEKKETIYNEANLVDIPIDRIIIQEATREELPYYINLAQLAIFFIKPTFSKKATSPTKQGEMMSMGIPIICNKDIGDTDTIIKENQGGIVINDFSSDTLKDTVQNLEKILHLNKENIIKTAHTYFSLKLGVEKYNEVYQSILEKEKK